MMNKGYISIVATSYNCPKHIGGLLRSLVYQDYKNFDVIIADDGSSDQTVELIKCYDGLLNLTILELDHGERGIARVEAIKEALKKENEFLLFVDADMLLKKELLMYALDQMNEDSKVDGLVIEEIPYSDYTNFFTKVKLFERSVLNNSKEINRDHSIEAARFWRTESYIKTGGINPNQIAFEEIQPTLRCLKKGGCIQKLFQTGMYHDEKEVTLANIMAKKHYYFSNMITTMESEDKGFVSALKRWYLFRPVYYQMDNLKLYYKHPILTFGMVAMYGALTLSAAYNILQHFIHKYVFKRKKVSVS